jgi:predicted transcriptional regulator
MPDSDPPQDLLDLTTRIVVAHVAHNHIAPHALPNLIQLVYRTLAGFDNSARAPERLPAVPIDRSVFPDHLVCLEDGKKLKMLKRHLKATYNMTPEQYRQRWGLPADYPMIAPDYAKRRSALARQTGLGRHRRGSGDAA